MATTTPTMATPPLAAPMDLIAAGLDQNSTALVQQGLDLFARRGRMGLDAVALDRALALAVRRASPDVVRYLLDAAGARAGGVAAGRIGAAVGEVDEEGEEEDGGVGKVGRVVGMLEVLVERGWDVDGRGAGGPDSLPLVYHVYRSEELLRWCLDHGARVDYADTDPPSVPPLLECVGKGGTVSAFKLLMKNGAKLGRRTLHRAVEGASSGAPERMDMVRFLVEEMGCDVNGMDMPEDKRYSAHYGTPLNYAAHKGGAVEVVMYLLEKGANPEIKDCWGFDAFTYARSGGKSVLEVLTRWREQREKVDA